jgi:hypothetical protein
MFSFSSLFSSISFYLLLDRRFKDLTFIYILVTCCFHLVV